MEPEIVREVLAYKAGTDEQARFQQATLDLLNNARDALDRRNVGHITASAVVLRSADSAVLLTLHPKYGRWLQLGGHMEPTDVSASAAALREAREESGIEQLSVAEIVDIDVHDVPCPTPDGAHYDLRFLVTADGNQPLTMSAESQDLRWFMPGEEPEGLDLALWRAISAARHSLEEHKLNAARADTAG